LEIFLEDYSAGIYSTIVKSINQWLPPFAKNDEKEAILYYRKELHNSLTNSAEAFQRKIESEYEANYNVLRIEAINSHKNEVETLQKEISALKEENQRLKKEGNGVTTSENSEAILQKFDTTGEKESIKDQSDHLSMVKESASEISVDYESMSLPELKKVAKEKKIKNYSKITDKEELIKLIKNIPPTLL
jgi:hypothetical protein